MATAEESSPGDCAWMLTSTALVLLMTPGLAFFYGGLVQGRSVLNTMLMSVICMGTVSMVWCLLGFSLAFGDGGGHLIGNFEFVSLHGLAEMTWPGTKLPALLFVSFQMDFAVIACAIVSGSIVERMRFCCFITFSALWSILVYAPVAHWVWGPYGWIKSLGAKDYAGGMVVHEITGISAVVLAKFLGPRRQSGQSEPHNVPFVILGAALLWFGWTGFNGGSALGANAEAAQALLNSNLSAGAALLVWSVTEGALYGQTSAVGAVTGSIVGLVVITPAAGFVTPAGAIVVGALGCLLVFPTFRIIHVWVDDGLETFPCHGIGGFVGTVLTGVFAKDGGLMYGGGLPPRGHSIDNCDGLSGLRYNNDLCDILRHVLLPTHASD